MSEKYKPLDPSGVYFITITLVEWVKLFDKNQYAEIIVGSIKYCQQNKGLELYGYCIMPSHVHMIARAINNNLPAIIRDIKKFTSVQLTRKLENDGDHEGHLQLFAKAASIIKRNEKYKVWQDGYHPEQIVTNKFFYQKLNYIHNNPLNDGLVNNPTDYLYCSSRNYAGLETRLEIIIESSQQITY